MSKPRFEPRALKLPKLLRCCAKLVKLLLLPYNVNGHQIFYGKWELPGFSKQNLIKGEHLCMAGKIMMFFVCCMRHVWELQWFPIFRSTQATIKIRTKTCCSINTCTTLAYHTDAKSQFLSKNSILMESTSKLNLNFPAKNGIIENLIFWTKIWILPQCASAYVITQWAKIMPTVHCSIFFP